MDGREAAEIKSIITGILISNPRRSTVKQLCKDFQDLEGRPIPFHKLGFTKLEDYLLSIPDTLKLYGCGPYAEVEGVISSKSEHINTMVLKQKKGKVSSINRCPKFKKYPTPRSNFNYPKLKRQQHNYSSQSNCLAYSVTSSKKPTNTYSVTSPKKPTNSSWAQNVVVSKEPNLAQKVDLFKESTNAKECSTIKADISEENLDDHKSSNLLVDDVRIVDEDKVEVTEADVSLDKSYSSRVPLKVRQNLKNLIQQFPDGLECTKLPQHYRNLYKKKIHYEEYGYRSLIHLCSDLPEIFHYVQQSSDDYILFDKNQPIPSVTMQNPTSSFIETVSTTHILEELGHGAINSMLLPSEVVTLSDEISRFFPADIEVGDIIDISFGEIYDPSKFWVYMTYGELDTLMRNLQDFFATNAKRYIMPELLLEEGLYCVALYAGQYHRGVIVNMLPARSNFVRVYFIDYGTVENVPTNEIWFLPKRFGELPSQAIRTRLSNIYPPKENHPWSTQALIRFEQLILNRDVVAEITKIDEKDHVLEVYLADITSKDNIFYINDRLVEEKHALYTDQKRNPCFVDYSCIPNVRYIHLYPEFYEIESGLAPTLEEMKYIIDNKIPLHHFMPQYFDISFWEDINSINVQEEKNNQKRISGLALSNIEMEEFDMDTFPDSMFDELKVLLNQGQQGKTNKSEVPKKGGEQMNESFKEYFCNKKRISELIHGNTDVVKEADLKECLDNHSSTDLFSSKSLSNISNSPERCLETSLNNSLHLLDISKGDSQSGTFSPTNPFRRNNILNNTNPFRSTNPFLTDLEETVNNSNLLGLFAKSSDESLPQKIVNNLKDDSCSYKSNKQVNIEKSNLSTNSTNLDPTTAMGTVPSNNAPKSPNKAVALKPADNRERQVRTPPGFSSRSLENRVPFNYNNNFNYMPGYSASNPYYQYVSYPQFNTNTYFTQNQLFMPLTQPSMINYMNYTAQFYPNQYFNAPTSPQSFRAPSNFQPPSRKS